MGLDSVPQFKNQMGLDGRIPKRDTLSLLLTRTSNHRNGPQIGEFSRYF